MYVVKLSMAATNKVGRYVKRGLIVFTEYTEYDHFMAISSILSQRLRRRLLKNTLDVTPYVPTNGTTWFVYIEYTAGNESEWEQDILKFINLPRRRQVPKDE